MYLKTAVVLCWFAMSYWLLYFRAHGSLQLVLGSISLALAMAGIGFNIQHDGSHEAYSCRHIVNRTMSFSLDLIGGSSYVWRHKHNHIHHVYTNVIGLDEDLDLGFLGRLSSLVPARQIHKYQHLYLWALYGLVALNWHFYSDFERIGRQRIGIHRLARPRFTELAIFIVGKLAFLCLMFVVPTTQRPIQSVVAIYCLVAFCLGLTLAVVFQLAHCVEPAHFAGVHDVDNREREWCVRQVEATVNFAPSSRLLTWYLGGLNYQIEHHLFPKVCHLHYPALAPIIERVCRDFGIRYSVHTSFTSALAAHYRHLKRCSLTNALAELP